MCTVCRKNIYVKNLFFSDDFKAKILDFNVTNEFSKK